MTPYEAAIGKKQEEELPVLRDDIAIQNKVDWLQSTGTQALVAGLMKDSNQLISDAVGLAQMNHQDDNSKLIVKKLIEANMLQKVIGKYVSIK